MHLFHLIVVFAGASISQAGSIGSNKKHHIVFNHLDGTKDDCHEVKQKFEDKERNYASKIRLMEEKLQASTVKEECTSSSKLDIQILMDSSGSINTGDFVKMKNQIADSLISQFDIGESKTRIALTQFGNSDETDTVLTLQSSYDKVKIQRSVKNAKYRNYLTYIAHALTETLKTFQRYQREEKDVVRVCFVFTDGKANDKKLVAAASKKWADNKVIIFALGIGKNVDQDGLELIAGDSSRAFRAANFQQIGETTKSMLKQVCKTIEEIKPKCDRTEEEYQELKTKCDQMKIDFEIRVKEFQQKEAQFKNETRIFHQKETKYKREIQELKNEVQALEHNITNLLSNSSEHEVSILSKYIFVHDRRSWNASQAYCQRVGGNLAVITTVEEQKNLMRIIKEKYSWDQAFWVGAKKGEYKVGEWKWLTGETMSLESPFIWAQENGVYQDGCLVLHPLGFARKDVKHGGFRGQGCCDDKHAFICETTIVDPICINEKYWNWALKWKNNYGM